MNVVFVSTLFLGVVLASVVEGATATNLQAIFRKGQTFVTFNEVSGASVTYQVYRDAAPIISVANRTPIAVLDQGSGINKYTNTNFIVTDLGSPLPNGTGLLVWTTSAAGDFYYAVTNSSDSSIVAGVNATTAAVQETVFAVPGSIQLKAAYSANGPGTNRVTEYFAWEDYAKWEHAAWTYYGHRYDVVTQPTLQADAMYPLTVILHPADGSGYKEPLWYVPPIGTGVYVIPRDNNFSAVAEPFHGLNLNTTYWYGHRRADGVVVNDTEQRVIRYVLLTTADPAFQVDASRRYISGASLGGGGSMHFAYHHPTLFAAAAPTIGWVDPVSTSLNYAPYFGSPIESGLAWNDWEDQAWLVAQRPQLPPIVYTFGKDDPILSAAAYPKLLEQTEAARQAYFAMWRNTGHSSFYLLDNADYHRFKSNEAYPAFSAAGNSDAFTAQEGQRNVQLDWSSALHNLGPGTGVTDTDEVFAMSFKSLSGDTTASVTIRNTQAFKLTPGTQVRWWNVPQSDGAAIQSGVATADSDGLITVSLQILGFGNRLKIARGADAGEPGAAPGEPAPSINGSTAPIVTGPSGPMKLRIVPVS